MPAPSVLDDGAMFADVQVTLPVACRDIASTPSAHRVLAW